MLALLSLLVSQTEADCQPKVGTEGVDEDGATDVLCTHPVVTQVADQDDEDCLKDPHDQELEWIDLPEDGSEADQNCSSRNATLDNIDKTDLDDKIVIHFCEAKHYDGELGDDHGDNHGEPNGRHPVPLEEGHQVAEAGQQHDEDVRGQRIG